MSQGLETPLSCLELVYLLICREAALVLCPFVSQIFYCGKDPPKEFKGGPWLIISWTRSQNRRRCSIDQCFSNPFFHMAVHSKFCVNTWDYFSMMTANEASESDAHEGQAPKRSTNFLPLWLKVGSSHKLCVWNDEAFPAREEPCLLQSQHYMIQMQVTIFSFFWLCSGLKNIESA